jgi:hypothetical protein
MIRANNSQHPLSLHTLLNPNKIKINKWTKENSGDRAEGSVTNANNCNSFEGKAKSYSERNMGLHLDITGVK